MNHLVAGELGGCQKSQCIGFNVRGKGRKAATPVFDDLGVSINGNGFVGRFLFAEDRAST